ncbi:hypothetical protein SNOG_01942 [Parastagonospora nodorum SN15]|uniref:Uncharacterized protein n=1 Tax=Phaeosphaeria nodorum (strain SN15 / ATCC MYA-4574 / FGSC 10173) TaxID=321614 RepID=Q0V222_PHANO|nr:hypothetical protein SNOG_01942 [Parastagonospora nodorum SN15]EAT90154.1 hypothetical protein SNOG_01942 [Parastagonospora nodorum SN15]
MAGLSRRKMAPLALLLLVLLGPGITTPVFAAPTNPPTTHLCSEAINGLVGVIVAVTMILTTFAKSPSLRRTLIIFHRPEVLLAGNCDQISARPGAIVDLLPLTVFEN